MRAQLHWSILVIAAALLEATWLRGLSIQGVVPDLVLVLVVWFAVEEGEERAMYAGVLGGIIQDAAANTALGQHVLCLIIVGFTVGRLSQRLITDNPYVKAVAVLMASLIHGILFITIEYVQKVDMNALYTMSFSLLPKAFYTAFATPFVFFLASLTRRRTIRGSS